MLLNIGSERVIRSRSLQHEIDATAVLTFNIELRARSELGGAHRREVGWVRAEQPPRGPEVVMKPDFALQGEMVVQQHVRGTITPKVSAICG